MSIAVPPGPYFLSELLAVRMTLANHSQTTYQVQGYLQPSYCDSALWVESSGGGPPTYTWPTFPGFMHCPGGMNALAPGEQWSIVQFFPLTPSGRVTLSAHATFCTARQHGAWRRSLRTCGGVGPFTAGWPSVTIQVAPEAPMNRTIVLTSGNGRVSISAPHGRRRSAVLRVHRQLHRRQRRRIGDQRVLAADFRYGAD